MMNVVNSQYLLRSSLRVRDSRGCWGHNRVRGQQRGTSSLSWSLTECVCGGVCALGISDKNK